MTAAKRKRTGKIIEVQRVLGLSRDRKNGIGTLRVADYEGRIYALRLGRRQARTLAMLAEGLQGANVNAEKG